MYTAPFDNLSVTNDSDQDIFELITSGTVSAIIHEFELYSSTTTDERVRLRLVRRSTTGSGGASVTEVALDEGNTVAATVTANTLVTTPGTIGAILKPFYWSQLSPLIYLPTPEERIVVKPASRLCLNLETAVASTRTWSGYVAWEEIGA